MSESGTTGSESTKFCEFDLGDNGGRYEFTSRKQAEDWLDAEIDIWKWTAEPEQRAAPRADLRSIKQQLASQDDASFAHEFRTRVTDVFGGSNKKIHSESAFGKFVLTLCLTSPAQARWALATKTDLGSVDLRHWKETRPVILGTARALLFELGIDAGSCITISEDSQREWSTRLTSAAESLESQICEAGKLKADLATAIKSSETQKRDDQEEWMRLCNEHSNSMSEIEKEWAERIKMRKAVDYWNERKNGQRKTSIVWAIAALVLMAVAICRLRSGVDSLGVMSPEIASVVDDVRSKKIEGSIATLILTQSFIRNAAPIVLPAMLFIWLLRIVVRNYVSASHLMTDASEREVLIQTYLALSTDKDLAHIPEIRDKALPQMLASVFRHTADGLVKDDGLPTQAIVDLAKPK